jgi:uncharacterized protein (TIGR00725 family)
MSVTVFFGSGSICENDSTYKEAMLLGQEVASLGLDLATGGYGGVMEAALRGAAGYNVKRIGVTCNFFKDKYPNEFLSDEIKTKNYFERLEILIDIGDIFIVLEGESGTLLEVAAVIALLERKIIFDRQIILIGAKWKQIIEVFDFAHYNSNIFVADNIIEATSIIKNLTN